MWNVEHIPLGSTLILGKMLTGALGALVLSWKQHFLDFWEIHCTASKVILVYLTP